MTLSLRADRRLVRAHASSVRYLLASFVAPDAPPRLDRLPVSVALVLDRSGSMSGLRKFPLAREAVEQALRLLRPDDRFTLVVYDEKVDVLVSTTEATADARRRAIDALRDVQPRGSTDLCAGWLRGCEQLADHLNDEGVARALLLTDGLANHGITDPGALATHAGELRRRGIATSTFGVGEDFDERLLRDMAHEGSGNFYFVETPVQIPDLLTSELGEALEVVIRNAALEITLPRRADAEPLNRFLHSRGATGNVVRVELGDLVSGQQVDAVIRLQLPEGKIGETATVGVALIGDGAVREAGTVVFTYASHDENDRQPRDVEVDREVAKLYSARARAEATEANRQHDYEFARRVLERTAGRILRFAGDDTELNAIALELQEQLPQYAEEPMSPMGLKMAMYVAEAQVKGRSPEGRARRAPRS